MALKDRAISALLKTYKLTFSPVFMALGARCRHEPSCSEYAAGAVRLHGLRGVPMALGRVWRCRPGGTHGWDPVPERPGGVDRAGAMGEERHELKGAAGPADAPARNG